MISARIIADSNNEFGNRITTFVLTFPRIVLAEFNTHRALSRNSASSRAIPFPKMLKMVEENPFIPLRWQKEHTGMQGTEYFTDEDLIQEALDVHTPAPEYFRRIWLEARDAAIDNACHLHNNKLTKQIVNRLIEPFLYHTVIVTATEWDNFFALRAHPDAEIHIADLAEKMLVAYNESTPKQLKGGEWHIPFGDNINLPSPIPIEEGLTLEEGVAFRKVMVATARCARVSYNNFEGKDDHDADIKLYHRLLSSGHLSPFEHCARAMTEYEQKTSFAGRLQLKVNDNKIYMQENYVGWCGNFRGFVQLRKTIDGENKSDSRVIIK